LVSASVVKLVLRSINVPTMQIFITTRIQCAIAAKNAPAIAVTISKQELSNG
jgi:hypothetical protein